MKTLPPFISGLVPGISSWLLFLVPVAAQAAGWPMFRGPTGDGMASGAAELPVEFGPSKNLAWKTELPAGHSSPIVWEEKIFLTGSDPVKKQLEVLCLSVKTGEVLWQKAIVVDKFEHFHKVSNAATATPVTDGERVVSYFGSFGVICHDLNGKELWRYPMPTFDCMNGCGTSPALANGTAFVHREDNVDQVLIALDAKTGKEKWKAKHPNAQPNMMGVASTPLVWRDQILIHRSGALSSHSLKDGSVNWFVPAKTTGTSTPIVDGQRVIFCAWNNAGEPDQIPPWPKFSDLLEKHDANRDGKLSREEFPKSLSAATRPGISKDLGGDIPFSMIWGMFDSDNNNAIDAEEFTKGIATAGEFLKGNKHGIAAVELRPDGTLSEKGVVWKIERGVPEVPSPVAYQGKVYFIRNDGLLTCVDAASGKTFYDERIGIPGPYFASPIIAGGKLYFAAGEGKIAVVSPGEKLQLLATNQLGEPIYASPAVTGNKLLVRTIKRLYAFEKPRAAN